MGSNEQRRGDPAALGPRVEEREALFAALTAAVAPGGGPHLLVVTRVDVLSTPTPTAVLLDAAGLALNRLLGPDARIYRARRAEFWVLLDGDRERHQALLDSINAEVAAQTQLPGLRTPFGVAVVPDEAQTPEAAVALAHQRLRASRDSREEGGRGMRQMPAETLEPESRSRVGSALGWRPSRRGRRER